MSHALSPPCLCPPVKKHLIQFNYLFQLSVISLPSCDCHCSDRRVVFQVLLFINFCVIYSLISQSFIFSWAHVSLLHCDESINRPPSVRVCKLCISTNWSYSVRIVMDTGPRRKNGWTASARELKCVLRAAELGRPVLHILSFEIPEFHSVSVPLAPE